MTKTSTTYRAEFRDFEGWTPYHGLVRNKDGAIIRNPEKSLATMRLAIAQWDEVERYEWRIIKRVTRWTEEICTNPEG